MLISLQNVPTTLPSNLLTSLNGAHEADRSLSILDALTQIGALRRTGRPHQRAMRILETMPKAHIDLAIARIAVPLMATVWNEVSYQLSRRKPEFWVNSPQDAVLTRESLECILWGLYALEDVRLDMPYLLSQREDLELEVERFDEKYWSSVITFPFPRGWRRQQRKMLTETDRRDWWWYD